MKLWCVSLLGYHHHHDSLSSSSFCSLTSVVVVVVDGVMLCRRCWFALLVFVVVLFSFLNFDHISHHLSSIIVLYQVQVVVTPLLITICREIENVEGLGILWSSSCWWTIISKQTIINNSANSVPFELVSFGTTAP